MLNLICKKWKESAALSVTILSLLFSLTLANNSWARWSTNPQVSPLIEQLNSEDRQKRLDAVDALSQIAASNDIISPDVIRALTDALKDPNPDVRLSAINALRGIGTGAEDSISALVEILQDKQQTPDVRRSAVLAIRSIDAGRAVRPLIAALDDQDFGVRSNAAGALGSIRTKAQGAVPKLIELLTKDPNSNVRIDAADALAKIAPQNRMVISALNVALTDSAWFVRRSAADALSTIGAGAKEAVPNLREALQNQNHTLRAVAAVTLGNIGPAAKEAVPDLRKALKDKNMFVRGNAAEALGNIGTDDQTTIQALSEVLKDPEAFVRSKAIAAFRKTAGNLQEKVRSRTLKLDDAIDLLDNALKVIKQPELGFAKEDITDVEQHLQVLETQRAAIQFINYIVKNPWVWVAMLYLVSHFGIFWLRPLWLLKIDESLKPLSFKVPPLGTEISLRFLLFLKYHPRVLDAWVVANLKSVREEFQKKNTVEARQVHIPIPVILDGRTISKITSQDLRSKFKKHLLIWGEGGVGKTNLACQIAKWAMSDNEQSRFCKHRMLPVLIEEDLDCEATEDKQALIAAIQGQLQDLTVESEPISKELLERLLRQQRILVIIDHLSEMSAHTRKLIRPEMPDFPANALVVTSRSKELLGRVTKTTIEPLRIMGNRLSSFMEAYLMERGKRDLFADSEFFDACSRLSRMVGQREVTAMLATLYAEQLIAAKVGAIQEVSLSLPDNIPDLMIGYLNELNRDVKEDKLDDRTVHQDAKAIAWACVREMYRPATIKREAALAALAERGEQAEVHLKYLEDRLHLIQTIGATEDHIRFSLDPLAEYLAGLYLIDRYDDKENLWLQFLEQSETIVGAPESISGFLGAVQDCCLAKGKESKVPVLVVAKLAQLQNKEVKVPALIAAELGKTQINGYIAQNR